FFPPARAGWRAFLQPFEKPTLPALQDISFELRDSESIALLGANGAGKSTLLRILATLLLPTSGHATIAGHDAVSSPRAVRRSLARALFHSPRVLLLDEPTRSLDAIAAASFRHFLKSQVMQPGKTSLLFASHSLAEIELLANRVAVLQHGRLIVLDTPAALKR